MIIQHIGGRPGTPHTPRKRRKGKGFILITIHTHSLIRVVPFLVSSEDEKEKSPWPNGGTKWDLDTDEGTNEGGNTNKGAGPSWPWDSVYRERSFWP